MIADDAPVELVVPFDRLETLAGRAFRGRWFTLAADRLDLFDAATHVADNPYPFDDGGYPEHLVEGFHLLGLLDHLSNPLVRLADGPPAGWNYGLDRVRFVTPVRAGDPIRLTGVVGEVRPRGDGALVLLRCVVEAAGREKPAFVADWWVLFERPEPQP